MFSRGSRGVSGVIAALIILSVILFSFSIYAIYNTMIHAREEAVKLSNELYSLKVREKLDLELRRNGNGVWELVIRNSWHLASVVEEILIVNSSGQVSDYISPSASILPGQKAYYILGIRDPYAVMVVTRLGNVFTIFKNANDEYVVVNIIVRPIEGGTTSPPPGIYTYRRWSKLVVRAYANENYTFYRWLVNGEYAGSLPLLELVLDKNYTIIAEFREWGLPEVSGFNAVLLHPGGTLEVEYEYALEVVAIGDGSATAVGEPARASMLFLSNYTGTLIVRVPEASLPPQITAKIYQVDPETLGSLFERYLSSSLYSIEIDVRAGSVVAVEVVFEASSPIGVLDFGRPHLVQINYEFYVNGTLLEAGGWYYSLLISRDVLYGPDMAFCQVGETINLNYSVGPGRTLHIAPNSALDQGLITYTVRSKAYTLEIFYTLKITVSEYATPGIYVLTLYTDAPFLSTRSYQHLVLMVSGAAPPANKSTAIMEILSTQPRSAAIVASPGVHVVNYGREFTALVSIIKYGFGELNITVSHAMAGYGDVSVVIEDPELALPSRLTTMQTFAYVSISGIPDSVVLRFVMEGDAYGSNSLILRYYEEV